MNSTVTPITKAIRTKFTPKNDMYDDIILLCKGHYRTSADAVRLGHDQTRLRNLLIILGPHLAQTQISLQDLIIVLHNTITTELPHALKEIATPRHILQMSEGFETAVDVLLSVIANAPIHDGTRQLYEGELPDPAMQSFIDAIAPHKPGLEHERIFNSFNKLIAYQIG